MLFHATLNACRGLLAILIARFFQLAKLKCQQISTCQTINPNAISVSERHNQMEYRPITCPFTHHTPTHVYLVQTEEQFGTQTFRETRSAHGDKSSAEAEAMKIANQHKDLGPGEQSIASTYPDYQTSWHTTYTDGLWKVVRVCKVIFVAGEQLMREEERERGRGSGERARTGRGRPPRKGLARVVGGK